MFVLISSMTDSLAWPCHSMHTPNCLPFLITYSLIAAEGKNTHTKTFELQLQQPAVAMAAGQEPRLSKPATMNWETGLCLISKDNAKQDKLRLGSSTCGHPLVQAADMRMRPKVRPPSPIRHDHLLAFDISTCGTKMLTVLSTLHSRHTCWVPHTYTCENSYLVIKQ